MPRNLLAETPPTTGQTRNLLVESTAATDQSPGMAEGLARAATQGATFNFGDELEAGARALIDVAQGKGKFQESFDRNIADIRGSIQAFRAEHPVASIGAEMAGAFAIPGFGSAKAAGTGITATGRIARGLALGAGSGAVAGAGAAEGGLAERSRGAVTGSLVGGSVGAAIPAVGAGLAALGRGATSAGRASAQVRRALARDGLTPERAQQLMAEAAARGQPATLADIAGENTRQLLFRAATTPGEARNMVAEFLEERAKGQMGRLSEGLKRTLGVQETGTSAIKAAQNAQKAAHPFYERAFSAAEIPQDVAKTFANQSKTAIGQRAARFMRRNVLGDMTDDQIKGMLAERPVALLDAYKRGLDEVIGTAKRSGENALARAAQRMKQELLEGLDAAVPDYAQARKIWSDEAAFTDAVDFGRSIFTQRQGVTSENFISEFNKLTPGERLGAMHGALDALIAKAESVGEGTSIAEFLAKPGNMTKLMAVVPKSLRPEWQALLNTERQMAKTVQKVLRGSPTAGRQVELGLHDGFVRALKTLAGDVWQWVPFVGGRALEPLRERQAAEMARRITSGSASAAPQMSRLGGGALAQAVTPAAIVPLVGGMAEEPR